MKLFSRCLVLLCLFLQGTVAYAQLTADFSAFPREGCSPLNVNFSEEATGNPTGYKWFFGNGNTSDTSDPSVIYISPGTYDITFIVTNGNEQDTIVKEDHITVFANPQAAFSAAPRSGCAPKEVNFEDQSTVGDAPIVDWLWDFGDGTIDYNENPSHTYTTGGSFNISLKVIDDNGCQSVEAKADYIDIDVPPNAQFSAESRNGCSTPHTVHFDNQSTGSGNVNYEWHFGDGATSTQESPSHTYADSGSYDIMLVAINNGGCRDTVRKLNRVKVFDLAPKIGVNATHGCIQPEATEFEFENQTESHHNFSFWKFGDGISSNQTNPSHTYDEPGVYEVQLIIGNGICLDTVAQEISVQQLAADFSMDTSVTCDTPFTVNFTGTGQNITSWNWMLGDNATASGPNATHTFTEPGKHKIRLAVEDQYGCVDTIMDEVNVAIPGLNIFTADSQGCKPVQSVLIAQPNSIFTFTDYEWTFHNGNTATGQVANRTYNDTGSYEVQLKGTTENGCEATTSITIEVGEPPAINSAMLQKDTVCVDEGLNMAFDFELAGKIEYSFSGQGVVFSGEDSVPVGISAHGDPGVYDDITFTPFFKGCKGPTYSLDDSLVVVGNKAEFAFSVIDCSDPYTIQLNNESVGEGGTYTWTFPDGSTQFTEDATYTFPDTGTYEVMLEITNPGGDCYVDLTKEVTVYDPKAAFVASDTAGCRRLDDVELDASSSTSANHYEWTFPDGSVEGGPSLDATSYTFDTAGTYQVSLEITAPNGCKDQIAKPFVVFPHETAIVNAGEDIGCVPFAMELQAQVNTDTSIAAYEWDIDGDSVKFSKDISLNFHEEGTYKITLTSTDDRGCTSTANVNLTASQPTANFFPDRVEACKYDPILFENYSNPEDHLTYEWVFGDGGTSTEEEPEYGFTQRGTHDVMLVVTDTLGCTDTLVREDYININAPKADLTVDTASAPCSPLTVHFINKSSNDATEWKWSFGDNSGSVKENPDHQYTTSGKFDVSVIATNNDGCSDTIVYPELIKIGGPTGQVNISPDSGCAPHEVTFEVTQQEDVNSVEWDFGDGVVGQGPITNHTYNSTGIYFINVTLSNNDCNTSYEKVDTIVVDTMKADFSIADDELCVGESIEITDQSVGNINEWHWQIDTHQHAGQQVPGYQFKEGQYSARLKAVSGLGCVDSVTKSFEVFTNPIATVSGDTFACEGTPAQLMANSSAISTYEWIPAAGIAEPQSRTPLATPESTTEYSVVATDDHGCSDTSEGHLLTIYPDLTGDAYPDTTIIIGDTIGLQVDHNLPVTGYTWQPEPTLSCDTCRQPLAFPMSSTDYIVTIADTQGCDELQLKAEIEVDDAVNVAIPEAFTPDGDGRNDEIYIQGWGIQELLDFRIYNRWGELVFRTSNIDESWDGTFQGKPQDVGSFVYVVKVRSFSDKVVTKKGSFSLIR